ncbi:MAG: HAMP domain-containing sensor histidine kinase, partial [Bacteroidota bacterium]
DDGPSFGPSHQPPRLIMKAPETTPLLDPEELLTRNRELMLLMSKVSHNLKAPIATIRGINNLALKRIQDPDARHFFDLISRSTDLMQQIVSDLLAFSKVTSAIVEVETLDLPAIVDDIHHNLQYRDADGPVRFELNFDHALPFGTDKALMSAIIQNLLENAFKFRNPENPEGRVQLSTTSVGDNLQLQVTDNGIGIPNDQADKVFNMFYRAHEAYPGNGLGLFITKRCAEKLRGTIALDRTEAGTRFTVCIPNVLHPSDANPS